MHRLIKVIIHVRLICSFVTALAMSLHFRDFSQFFNVFYAKDHVGVSYLLLGGLVAGGARPTLLSDRLTDYCSSVLY